MKLPGRIFECFERQHTVGIDRDAEGRQLHGRRRADLRGRRPSGQRQRLHCCQHGEPNEPSHRSTLSFGTVLRATNICNLFRTARQSCWSSRFRLLWATR